MVEKRTASRCSRRDFLKGAGLTATGIVGAGLLGACSSPAQEKKPAAADKPVEKWDYEADVVIVGTGTSGAATAVSAIENGAKKVLMIDKWDMEGGLSSACEQYTTFGSSKLNVPEPFEGLKDSPEKLFEDVIRASDDTVDKKLAKIWVEGSADAVDWVIGYGAEFKDKMRVSDGRDGYGKYISKKEGVVPAVLLEEAKKKGTEILLKSKLTSLVKDENGRVTGIRFEKEGEGEKTAKADKGVVICSGLWVDDEIMLPRHRCNIPEPFQKTAEAFQAMGAPFGPYTGEAVRAAQRAGAAVRHMEYLVAEPFYATADLVKKGVAPAGISRSVSQVMLTSEGKRFVNEGLARGAMAEYLMKAPGCIYYPVMDGHIVPDTVKASPEKLQQWVDEGYILKADTIENLAAQAQAKFNVPKDEIVKSIERYNSFCQSGVDEDFGKAKILLLPVDKAPFYFGPVSTGRVLYTHGGLDANENAQVVDLEGKPIEGLYAVGMCTGGHFGQATISGSWQVNGLVFGRIAGKHLMKG